MQAERSVEPTGTNKACGLAYFLTDFTSRRSCRPVRGLWFSLVPRFPAFAGGHRGVVIPVPIPNTEVKGSIAEGSVGPAHARVGRRRLFFSLRSIEEHGRNEERNSHVYCVACGMDAGGGGNVSFCSSAVGGRAIRERRIPACKALLTSQSASPVNLAYSKQAWSSVPRVFAVEGASFEKLLRIFNLGSHPIGFHLPASAQGQDILVDESVQASSESASLSLALRGGVPNAQGSETPAFRASVSKGSSCFFLGF